MQNVKASGRLEGYGAGGFDIDVLLITDHKGRGLVGVECAGETSNTGFALSSALACPTTESRLNLRKQSCMKTLCVCV